MNRQSLRPLGLMILALLRERDMHPYEMIQLLKSRREDRLVSLHAGTFYNQIAGLERDGLISPVATEREGARPERTTYALTDAGADSISEWVRENLTRIDREEEFRVALAEAHNLPTDEVIALLDQRIDALTILHAEFRGAYEAALALPVQRQFLIEHERQTVLFDADITFTRALRDSIASGQLPWGIPVATTHRKDGA